MKNLGMKLKSRELYIYIVIIAVQVLVILYWGRLKTNYYEDDFYSMGYASSFTGKGDTARYITTSPDFSFHEWINNSILKKYLIVSDEEKVFNAPFFNVMQKFITGRNYFGFLNLAESIAGYSFVSSRPGILLNIIFFIIAEFSLVSLMKKLNFDMHIRYLSLAMFGFSCYVISAAVYIRFYMMVIMTMIMIFNLLYRLWNSEQWKQIIFTEAEIMLLTYFTFKNSELMAAYFGAVMGSLIIAFFLTKKWRQLFSCIAVCLFGVGFLLVTTDYMGMLLYPGNYSTSSRVAEASIKISEASFGTIINYLYWVKQLFETYYFGSYWIIYLLAGAFTICFILVSDRTDDKHFYFDMNKIRPVTNMSIFFWLAVLIFSHILGQGFYICVLVLCLIMFLAAKEAGVFGYRMDIKKIKVASDTAFVLVLASAMGIYTIFNAIALNIRWRYYCYGFVSGTIIAWYVLDRLIKKSLFKKAERSLYIILMIFVIINALIPFHSRNIEYIYENDAGFIENIKNNQGLDVVLLLNYDDGNISQSELYDCINLMSEDVYIYFMDLGKYEYSSVDYPDEFMLWSHKIRDLSTVLEELSQHGYDLWELGSDHCSKAYVCKLR